MPAENARGTRTYDLEVAVADQVVEMERLKDARDAALARVKELENDDWWVIQFKKLEARLKQAEADGIRTSSLGGTIITDLKNELKSANAVVDAARDVQDGGPWSRLARAVAAHLEKYPR